jgi:hypothetical protein
MADDDRDREEIDREAVLARRSKLVAVALASLTALSGAAACGPTACLRTAPPRGPDAGTDGGPDGGGDGGPDPDGGDDAGGIDGGGGIDSGARDAGVDAGFPMPCLSMIPPDSGTK